MENELENFIKGGYLGSGAYRTVYNYSLYGEDADYVIKIARTEDGRQHNLIEAKIWLEVKYSDYSKWFAPVSDVSEAGKYLIQRKAELGRKKDYPKKIPTFFTDEKYSNYGWIDNNFVCIDYGSMIITNGLTKRTKTADWWNNE